jgi:bis(5'-adenosyl)-triphosphatase
VQKKTNTAGHVLVIPARPVLRLHDLSPAEVADLFLSARRVGAAVAGLVLPAVPLAALTVTVQDGPAAGQTVPQVHVHVIPRAPGDLARNDEVYERIDASEERVARSLVDMASEAALFRTAMTQEELAGVEDGTTQ